MNSSIIHAQANFERKQLEVQFVTSGASPRSIAEEVLKLGYTPCISAAGNDTSIRDLYVRLAVAAFGAMNTMMLSVSLYQGQSTGMEERYRLLLEWASFLISLPVILFSAVPFYRRGVLGLLRGVVHIDLPLSLGIIIGFVASTAALMLGGSVIYFDSLCMLVCLLLVGQVLQAEGLRRARFGAESDWALLPQLARKLQGLVPIAQVKSGDLLIVEDGEMFPVDGVVEVGESAINKAVITGEAIPEKLAPGSEVIGGGVNYGGVVQMRASADAATSQLALLESAVRSGARSKLSRVVDGVSRRFVQVVLSASAVSFLGWWLLAGNLQQAVLSTVSLLVVTCPCALGLSIPLAIRVALSRARARGILIKDEAALEAISTVKKVYFDKTGTLTEPSLSVSEIWRDEQISKDRAAAIVLALEAPVKNHPIAESLRRYAVSIGAPEISATEVVYTPGSGVSGAVDCVRYELSALSPSEVQPVFSATVVAANGAGCSCLALRADQRVLVVFSVQSALRSDARQVVSALKLMGREVLIVSGDSTSAVCHVGSELGVDGVQSGVSPRGKAEVVGANSMMIGDGVNDLLALRAAAVGVGISGGVAASMSASSVFLRSGRLSDVVTLVRGADDVMRVVRRSLVFSLTYNIITGVAAVLGYINPFIAAILMPFSSLSVISISNFNRVFQR
jgi:Cu2+-exporting ATPase